MKATIINVIEDYPFISVIMHRVFSENIKRFGTCRKQLKRLCKMLIRFIGISSDAKFGLCKIN